LLGDLVSQQWYYAAGNERHGPVSAAELKTLADAGTLKPTDLVWKDGMADWVPARSIKGLFPAGASPVAPATSKSGEQPAAARSGGQAAARPRPAADEEDDRPSRARRREEEAEEDDRPSRRRRDEDDDDDRPSRSRRRDEDDEDDRPLRRRDDDEDRPRRRGGRVPEDIGSRKMTAGLLGIFLGALGVHKFYLGMTNPGVVMLCVSLLGLCGCGLGIFLVFPFVLGIGYLAMAIIGLIEGIIYLSKSEADFYRTYVVEQKGWF
jgi:TM2 domain-containing membrane protein YozV